ncbi:MAG TPA: NAD-dependent epimerase/dehydratase family protein [Clostridiaceae bacterium]
MRVLVLGGTRYFGVHLVNSLLKRDHTVTIATRGRKKDTFGDNVERLIVERTDPDSLAEVIGKRHFDAACDNLAFCSDDVKNLLDTLKCERYVMTSSAAVYCDMRLGIAESGFDPLRHPLEWGPELSYDEGKRQAESALYQKYPQIPSATVRFPYVIGEDDYTGRLCFYVENIIKGVPMNIDNLDEQLAFVRSDEAGDFIAWAAEQKFTGPINGSSTGTISLQEIISYAEQKTGKAAVYSPSGRSGPFNGQESFSLDVVRAGSLGYSFSPLNDWIYDLLDKFLRK